MAGLEYAARSTAPELLVLEAGERDSVPVTDLQWCEPEARDASWWQPILSTHPRHFGSRFGIRRRLGGRSMCWHGVSLDIPSYGYARRWPTSYSQRLQTKGAYLSHIDSIKASLSVTGESFYSGDATTLFDPVPKLFSNISSTTRADHIYSPLDNTSLLSRATILTNSEVFDYHYGSDIHEVAYSSGNSQLTARCRKIVFAASASQNGRFLKQFFLPDYECRLWDHLIVGRTVVVPAPSILSDGFYYTQLNDESTRLFVTFRRRQDGIEVDMWTMGADCDSFSAAICKNEANNFYINFSDICHTQEITRLKKAVDYHFDLILRRFGCDNVNTLPWEQSIETHESIVRFADGLYSLGAAQPYESALGSSDHEHGTTPFGIVDYYGRLISRPTATFVGPSVFPSLGGANPTLSTLAHARTAALRQDDGNG